MKMYLLTLGFMVTIVFNSLLSSQSIPQTINYQGVLKTASGTIVPNGNYNIEFFLYDAETGGVVAWQEAKIVNVNDGIIITELGSINPLTIVFDKPYWLGIKVESGTELTPRVKLTTVPYSLMSLDVMNESISTTKIQNWAVTTTKLSDNSVTSSKILDGTIIAQDIGSYEVVKKVNGIRDSVNLVAGSNIVLTPSGNNITISALGGGSGNLNGSGTANYIPKFIGSTTLGNSILFESASGNIGVGTSTPSAKFELAGGDAKINGLTLGLGSGLINTNTALGIGTLYTNTTGMRNTAIGNQSLYFNTIGFDNTSIGHQSLNRSTDGQSNTSVGSLSLAFNTTGGSNTSVGASSLLSNTIGINNTAVGTLSLFTNVFNSGSTAIGYGAMRYWGSLTGTGNDESECTAVGFESLKGISGLNNTGMGNTAIGYKSLYSNSEGYLNSAIGVKSLFSNSTGYYNAACGSYSLSSNTSGNNNTATGHYALYSNTTGSSNSALGSNSLYSNTIGTYNTAIGYAALSSNISGNSNTSVGLQSLFSNTTGSNNTAIGVASLKLNTTGIFNTAIGQNTLYFSTTGNLNTAVGNDALYYNSTGDNNTAIGYQSLYKNDTGYKNTANGVGALYFNTTGIANTACGYYTMFSNTTGSENTAIGLDALYYNTTGNYNTASGIRALYSNTTGNSNAAFGFAAYSTSPSLNNWTGIGYNVGGSTSTSNQVEIGNTSVTWIGGQVSWSSYSDGRFKENVSENVPGLSFIKKLRPVIYNLNIHQQNQMIYKGKGNQMEWNSKYDIEKIKMTGFIAQEVEQAAKDIGYDFSGVDKPNDENGIYSIRYSEFVVPLVKAMQEQQKIIEELTKRIEILERK